jgi:hypothetical protein
MTRTCRTCRQRFVPDHGNRKYCSDLCRSRPRPAVYRFIAGDGRSYVGSCADHRERAKSEIGRRNPRLERAFAIYPPETWTFEVLQRLPPASSFEEALAAEQIHIERLRSWHPRHGFNMVPASWTDAGPAAMAHVLGVLRRRNKAMARRWALARAREVRRAQAVQP